MSKTGNKDKILEKLNKELDMHYDNKGVSTKKDLDTGNSEYQYTIQRLKKLLDYGEDALEYMLEIAKETGEPRAFEVVSKMISDLTSTSNSIMNTKKTKTDVEKSKHEMESPRDGAGESGNNAVFIGSLKDLLDNIDKEKEDIKTIDAEVVGEEEEK